MILRTDPRCAGDTAIIEAMPAIGKQLAGGAVRARSSVMAKFELQKRFTASGLLEHMEKHSLLASGLLDKESFIDEKSIAQKYCSVGTPAKCGEIVSGAGYDAEWELKEEWDKASEAAARVIAGKTT